ncbi:MAG: hypothetical protein R2849_20555 [Thermomicrobiales bacterium]
MVRQPLVRYAEHVEITQVGNVVARVGGSGPSIIVLARWWR